MSKHSLTIHDLTDHSPAQRGRLVEYLSERFQLSADIIAVKLKEFPVTFKDWIEVEHIDEVTSELNELGVLFELHLGEPEGLATPATESDDTPEASETPDINSSSQQAETEQEGAVESSEPQVDPLAALSFDETGSEIQSADESDVEQSAPKVSAPAMTDLSFDAADSGEPERSASPAEGTATEQPSDNHPEPSLDFTESDSPPPAEPQENPSTLEEPEAVETPQLDEETKPEPVSITSAQVISDEELDSLFAEAEEPAKPTVPEEPSVSSEQTLDEHASEQQVSSTPPIHQAPEEYSGATEAEAEELDEEFEEEYEEEEYYEPWFSRPVVWTISAAVAVFAAVLGFTFGGGTDTTPEVLISSDTASRLLSEQKAILVVKKPNNAARTSKSAKSYVGEFSENGVRTEITIVGRRNEIVDLQVVVTTEPPPKLKPTEIVAGKPQPVWLNRFEVQRLEHYETFNTDDASKVSYPLAQFSLQTKGKAYMRDHAGRGRRIIAPILLEGALASDEKTIKGTWRIANGAPGEPVLPLNSAKFLGGKSYRLFYSSPFRAKLEDVGIEDASQDSKEQAEEAVTQSPTTE